MVYYHIGYVQCGGILISSSSLRNNNNMTTTTNTTHHGYMYIPDPRLHTTNDDGSQLFNITDATIIEAESAGSKRAMIFVIVSFMLAIVLFSITVFFMLLYFVSHACSLWIVLMWMAITSAHFILLTMFLCVRCATQTYTVARWLARQCCCYCFDTELEEHQPIRIMPQSTTILV